MAEIKTSWQVSSDTGDGFKPVGERVTMDEAKPLLKALKDGGDPDLKAFCVEVFNEQGARIVKHTWTRGKFGWVKTSAF